MKYEQKGQKKSKIISGNRKMLELFCFSTDFDKNLTGNRSLSETFIAEEFF